MYLLSHQNFLFIRIFLWAQLLFRKIMRLGIIQHCVKLRSIVQYQNYTQKNNFQNPKIQTQNSLPKKPPTQNPPSQNPSSQKTPSQKYKNNKNKIKCQQNSDKNNKNKRGYMFFGEQQSQADEHENIEQMLDDLAIGEQVKPTDVVKKDTTMFVIDCCQQIMLPLQGETKSEFEKIMESYSNFMMSKIIANNKDLVGLILYNLKAKNNSLNFDQIYVVQKLEVPSATAIKNASQISKDYIQKYGLVSQQVPLHHVLWLYGNQIKSLQISKNHLRLFLFTSNDCPHAQGDQRRQQAINHARQLASKNIEIQLFPIRRAKKCIFDIRKFYQEIVTVDPEDLARNTLDNSSKILDLQSRLRQKEFKKRTLNRLLMKIGNQADVGIKIFCTYNKAKKPLGKKVQATTNKPLKRVLKKMNSTGQVMFDQKIGTYYPLGGQKIKISKADMNQIKSLQKPGITLIGFKPKKIIKPYHNLRTSYFLYPDQEHVRGSSQFFDALIDQLIQTNMVAIVKIMPRQNQELRFAALFPQKQRYDEEDHQQTPPGFNMVILPYADDIVNFAGAKTVVKPQPISSQLVQVTKLLINNLTVPDFDFRDFQNPSLQKFYGHLQAHALNQENVEERPDLLMPDYEGLSKFKDIIDLVRQAANQEANLKKQEDGGCRNYDNSDDEEKKPKKVKKQTKKQAKKQVKFEQPQKKSKVKSKKSQKNQEIEIVDQKTDLCRQVEQGISQGQFKKLKVNQLKQYLKQKQLSDKGNKEELIDRIMVYISHINSI